MPLPSPVVQCEHKAKEPQVDWLPWLWDRDTPEITGIRRRAEAGSAVLLAEMGMILIDLLIGF